MTDRILYAYYDLAVSPPSYDICVFLYRAEMERLYLGVDAFDLIVVANSGDGFRYDLVYQSLNDMTWRLHHIVLPAHRLVPACRRVIFYSDRDEADRDFDLSKPHFPADYRVFLPSHKFLDSEVVTGLYTGRPPASLRAPAGAVEKMKSWSDHHVGDRKAIVISLRTERFQPSRNSNLDQWIRFARWLDPAIYQPIFVRDTTELFNPPNPALAEHLVCDTAAIDIEVRLALYELAHINLFVDSGPSVCCMLDDLTRCIRFKLITTNNPHAGPRTFLRRGYHEGMQWAGTTTHQISVWEEDTFETICREFKALEREIQTNKLPERRPAPPIMVAASNFAIGENWRDTVTLTSLALAANPDNVEARFLLATALMYLGERLAAAKEFQELFSIPHVQDIVLIPFATCLSSIGRAKQAAELLIEAAQKREDNIPLVRKIAQLLFEIGEDSAGNDVVRRLVHKAPNEPPNIELYARCLMHDDYSLGDAIVTLNKALLLAPNNASLHSLLATCLARVGAYKQAIYHLRTAISVNGKSGLEDWINIGLWSKYIGDETQAKTSFSKANAAAETRFDDTKAPTKRIIEWLGGKARMALIRNDKEEVHSCYRQMLRHADNVPYLYAPTLAPAAISEYLQGLQNIVRSRDVIIFCDGASASPISTQWYRFSDIDACLMSVSQFHEYEQTFLVQAESLFDVIVVARHNKFQQAIEPIWEFLSRGSQNLLITQSSVTAKLGRQCPTQAEIERRFRDKLLYFDAVSSSWPATPNAPFRFLDGNELAILIVYAAVSGARRIFLFGADDHISRDTISLHSQNGDGAEFGDFAAGDGKSLIDAVRAAEMRKTAHSIEIGLIAAEHLFSLECPAIFNVSSGNALDLFPRIDYDVAYQMLVRDEARSASTAAFR